MKRIIIASITAVVVIAVMAGTLIPILDDATATSDTLTNSGLYHLSEYDTTASYTLVWDHTAPNQVTVGTDVVTLGSTSSSFPYTLMCAEDFIVRYTYTSASNAMVQAWAEDWGSSQYQASVSAGTDMSITVSSGTVTLDNGGTTKSYTYTDDLYAISTDGDYVMKAASESAYVKSDSTTIIAAGRSAVGGSVNFWITGTLDDGFTIGNTYGDNISPTFSDIEYTATADADYVDTYLFDKITFTATYNETDYDVTYSQVIVPYQITAERSVHFTDGENAIFNAIPVMIIIALLLGVVALVLRSRMD